MLEKRWFKFFIWFVSTSFFFIASSIIISEVSPEPSEQQVIAYMSGMMEAMESSLLGLSMTIEQDEELKQWIINATSMTTVLIIISIVAGDYVRFSRKKNNG